MIQVQGEFMEYNPLEDNHISRAQDVFLCIDKLASQVPHTYLINVLDGPQKTSFTRKELNDISAFQLNP